MYEFSDETTCRICFKIQDTVYSLFRKREGFSPCEELNKLGVKIVANEAGPTCICCDCFRDLETTVNFLEKCQKSNQVLAEQFSKGLEFTEEAESYQNNSKIQLLVDKDATLNLENRVVKSVQDEHVDSNSGAVKISEGLVWEDARCEECGSRRRCRHWSPPTTHTCPQCSKVFNRKFNFKLHLKRHNKESEWSCRSCGTWCASSGMAARHCRPGPRPRRACPLPGCGKTYTTTTNLNTHLRGHRAERPFECNDCDKKFASKDTLQNHIRIHTGALPYICPICGKRFRTNKLSVHMSGHAVAAPARRRRAHAHRAPPAPHHACALCTARYRHKQSLNKHMRKQHNQKAIAIEVDTSEIPQQMESDL